MTLLLLRIGGTDEALLHYLFAKLPNLFSMPCGLLSGSLDPSQAFHSERQQYHSSELLQQMQPLRSGDGSRILGVATVDLYIPILTFVFGEAQVDGHCAAVSTWRLRQEFYGLPADHLLLRERLLKESVHELGHTFGLSHCDDYRCAMSATHSVELIDLKECTFCSLCRDALHQNAQFIEASLPPVSQLRAR